MFGVHTIVDAHKNSVMILLFISERENESPCYINCLLVECRLALPVCNCVRLILCSILILSLV